jgi:hypothetical protein
MGSMSTARRHVLLIGVDSTGLECLAPMLQSEEFDVHRVDASPFVFDLVRGTPFELLVAQIPNEQLSIPELIGAAREPGSLCQRAGLMIITLSEHLDAAQQFMDHGVNRIIALDWPKARLWQAMGDLLQVAPRIPFETSIQLALPREIARDVVVLRLANISTTGGLITGFRRFPPGTRFRFFIPIPGGAAPLTGTGEVVRTTDLGREGAEGFGVRWITLDGDGPDRLATLVGHRLAAAG